MKFFHYPSQSIRKGAIATLAFAALLLPACESYQQEATAPTTDATDAGVVDDQVADTGIVSDGEVGVAEENVQIADLTGNLADYVGRMVSVRAGVQETIGETAFLMENEQWFEGEQVLVVNATGQPFVLLNDTEVQATGQVQSFVLADVEREYGLDLDPVVYTEYENQPAIIAQSLAYAPDPAEISEDPTAFYNQSIAVEGSIDDFLTAGIFKLDEDQLFGGEGILVLSNPQQLAQATLRTEEDLEAGETVVVTGTLRPFVRADLERDYGFTWEQGIVTQIEAEYNEEPVLVAEEIYPSAE